MKQILQTILFVLCTGACAQAYRPMLEEGKTWTVDCDVAGGNLYHNYTEYNISESAVVDGINFWNVSWKNSYGDTGGTIEPEVVPRLLIGEKDERLYYWDGSEHQEPVLFMDFSLTAGSTLDFDNIKFDEHCVRLVVTAVSDTILECVSDLGHRHCLHVSYQTENSPDDWAEVERDVWLEGIGSLKYGIMFPYYFGTTGGIITLWECRAGETILYKAPGNPDGISSPSTVNGPLGPTGHLTPQDCSMPFDLQGRRLTAEPQRGVFIRDGKKVMK